MPTSASGAENQEKTLSGEVEDMPEISRESSGDATVFRRDSRADATVFRRDASGDGTVFQRNTNTDVSLSRKEPNGDATVFGHDDMRSEASRGPSSKHPPAPDAKPSFVPEPQPAHARIENARTIVAGRFLIVKALPSGQEAESALGHDLLDANRPVFIKRYRSERANARFIAKRVEMRDRLLALNHPNCVRMLTLEPPTADRPLTEVYEYLQGEQLSVTLARSPRPDDAFIRLALEQISAGLDAFQRAVSSVHRDIKPDNIMLVTETDGQPRFVICDYGTATATHIGGVTTFEGTLFYAPPESQSPKQLRDDFLKKFDWWSVGRIIQEMADGHSARDSIRAHVAGCSKEDDDAADARFYDILFGHGNGYNVRPGMVEWSRAEWRAPLRGLLTANRQLRWDYQQVRLWLAGRAPSDGYDADVDHQRFSFKGKDYEAADAARLLAQPEHWNDAIAQVIERTGIITYVRKSGNLRIGQELERVFEIHREIAPRDPKTADDLVVALALAAIGRAKEMPVTIRGEVFGPATMADYAANDRGEALSAISHPRFLERLAAISPNQHRDIEALVKRRDDIRARIIRFGESPVALDRCGTKLARYLFVGEDLLRERVLLGCKTYATSEVSDLAAAMATIDRASADDLAAIVYAFESGDRCFRLVTHATREKGEVEAVNRIANALRRAFALTLLAPLLAVAEQVGPPVRAVILGLVCALGWSVYAYSPLLIPEAVARNFAAYWIASGLIIFACAWLLRRGLVRFASNRTALGPTLPNAKVSFREAAAVRRAVLAGSERKTLIGLLIKTNGRIRALQTRHAELRTVGIPIPNAALLPVCGILAMLAAVPLGVVSGARQFTPGPNDISPSALATRLTTAYLSGNVNGAERYAEGTALEKLRDVAFTHIVQKRFATLGMFRGAHEETLLTEETLETPGRSIVQLQFAHRRLSALLVHSRRKALDFEIPGIMPAR